mmetsp:Transcript_23821/g.26430  ORF Transcript_23821/g.26430 Transcript_23821/m.26430 type:complete len:739 (+) Transcript_23821:12-2228(+)
MYKKLEGKIFLFFLVTTIMALEPFSTKKPVFTSVTHPLQPTDILSDFNTPYPTNTFWTNVALANGAGVIGEEMIPALPYMAKMRNNGVVLCMPSLFSASNYAAMPFEEDFEVFFQELSGSPVRRVSKYDDMSVTMTWNTNQLEVPIVPGSPYFSFKVDNMKPTITSEHVIISINGQSAGQISGDKFVIVLEDGPTGILYTSSSVSITWGSSSINFDSSFTGVIRLANSAIGESELDKYRDALVVGGTADIVFGQGNNANLEITWQTEGQGQLLMMALPHHQDLFSKTDFRSFASSANIRTLKGTMTGRVGTNWVLVESLPELRWESTNPIDSDKLETLRSALIEDNTTPIISPTDPYGFGKKVSRQARLVLIADQLGESEISGSLLDHLKTIITPWLEGDNTNPLLYDSTWGGVVSTNGLENQGQDFGQGYYNDHHFHYGYFLYALAVIGKYDISFINQHKDAVLDLARDIANPSTQDTYFTKLRHMDWYNGHSWASGIIVFGDAKNQESTSEAINGWYGLALLGEVLGNDEMKNLGRMLMATEIRGTKKYWHIGSKSDIYPPGFNTGKSVIGILWSSKVDYVTWFGANLEYIYGIQMLPFTPATELFLDDTDWVSESYEYLKTTNPNQEWKAFILSFLAIINKPQAWNEVQQLTSWDGGNSRTNTYYWVATRTNSKTNGGGGGGSNDDMDPHESKSEIIIALVVSCAIVGLVLLLVAIVGLPYIRKRNRRNTHYLAL